MDACNDLVLDLGCGQAKTTGTIGVDNVLIPGVDIVFDLSQRWYPVRDQCVCAAHLNHVLEHFDYEEIRHILQEVHRSLIPGGTVSIRVPHVFSVAAWVDPTHKMGFAFDSIRFFEQGAAKAYYRSTDNLWQVVGIRAGVTWFNWKRYQMRKVDRLLSRLLANWLNWLLKRPNLPGSADLLVKRLPVFLVEIQWDLQKPGIER
ncbi:MAG: hypothetical protein ABIJ39_06915 [Chloroflexota bacterium]